MNYEQANARMKRRTLTTPALSHALTQAFVAAVESTDIGKMVCLERIVEREAGLAGFDGLLRQIRADPAAFVLEAAPGFGIELQICTGRSRDAWAEMVG